MRCCKLVLFFSLPSPTSKDIPVEVKILLVFNHKSLSSSLGLHQFYDEEVADFVGTM
jgi:hypothetical protein